MAEAAFDGCLCYDNFLRCLVGTVMFERFLKIRGRVRLVGWLARLPLADSALRRVPVRRRPALFFETFYNIGAGAFIALFLLSLAALKSDQVFSPKGSKEHLMFVAAMFGGSSMLSPLVSYLVRFVPMRLLMIVPNLLVAVLLFATGVWKSADVFALIVGLAFIIRVFPRVGEMNMYRELYPPSHRGAAVGWLKAVAGVSGLTATTVGSVWFMFQPNLYYLVYWCVGIGLALSAVAYAQIPVRKKNVFVGKGAEAPHRAFSAGVRAFLSDRRFVLYQIGFWFAGFANHMSMAYVAESLKEDVQVGDTAIFMIVAVVPVFLMASSAPLWGRYLDNVNPMTGRALFNSLQCIAYAFHWYGGFTRQMWPFIVGSVIHAISNGGGTINWLTGSLYFAKPENVSLYNSLHVGLTGVRGMTAPILGVYIYGSSLQLGSVTIQGLGMGPALFAISSVLSLCGAAFMLWMTLNDTGPSEVHLSMTTSTPAAVPAVAATAEN